ncbi:MAG TPA: hypothetical protein PK600_03845 [Deltaproteobacteria bacterium]|nr:hypothetical protein [Deltaproteobacteria bacterium]
MEKAFSVAPPETSKACAGRNAQRSRRERNGKNEAWIRGGGHVLVRPFMIPAGVAPAALLRFPDECLPETLSIDLETTMIRNKHATR